MFFFIKFICCCSLNQEIELGLVVSQQPEILGGGTDLHQSVTNLERDLLYLKKMKEMDDEIQRLVMTGGAKPQKFGWFCFSCLWGWFCAHFFFFRNDRSSPDCRVIYGENSHLRIRVPLCSGNPGKESERRGK